MVKVRVDHEKCDGRGTCVNIYPVDVFEIREKKRRVINPDECLVCRACAVQYPNGTIEIIE